ncbi:MAG TPA: hypothetical protein PKW33_16335 [Anaerolineaceae bacterium]|nr:hypothetical protein [Anaerolineaceae bacterium]HPN53167.1 hypothetical protein [Anaerolineaceae bacterium]
MKLKSFTILQITPAAGFNAVFANEDGTINVVPLACWALVRRVLDVNPDELQEISRSVDIQLPGLGEPMEITRVEGMAAMHDTQLISCENEEEFLGYSGPGENPMRYQKAAQDLMLALAVGDDEDDDDDDMDLDEDFAEELSALGNMAPSLPQALSHLSVQVQEVIRNGQMPPSWEDGGWLEFMRRFGDLSGG